LKIVEEVLEHLLESKLSSLKAEIEGKITHMAKLNYGDSQDKSRQINKLAKTIDEVKNKQSGINIIVEKLGKQVITLCESHKNVNFNEFLKELNTLEEKFEEFKESNKHKVNIMTEKDMNKKLSEFDFLKTEQMKFQNKVAELKKKYEESLRAQRDTQQILKSIKKKVIEEVSKFAVNLKTHENMILKQIQSIPHPRFDEWFKTFALEDNIADKKQLELKTHNMNERKNSFSYSSLPLNDHNSTENNFLEESPISKEKNIKDSRDIEQSKFEDEELVQFIKEANIGELAVKKTEIDEANEADSIKSIDSFYSAKSS